MTPVMWLHWLPDWIRCGALLCVTPVYVISISLLWAALEPVSRLFTAQRPAFRGGFKFLQVYMGGIVSPSTTVILPTLSDLLFTRCLTVHCWMNWAPDHHFLFLMSLCTCFTVTYLWQSRSLCPNNETWYQLQTGWWQFVLAGGERTSKAERTWTGIAGGG